MLHVLFIFLHCSPSLSVRGEPHVSLSTGPETKRSEAGIVTRDQPPVVVVMNEDVHRVRHGAEPLRYLLITNWTEDCRLDWSGDHLLRNSEWKSSHVQTEHPAPPSWTSHHPPSIASSHGHPPARRTVSKEVVREVATSARARRSHPSKAHPVPIVRSRPHWTAGPSHGPRAASHGQTTHLVLSSPGLLHAGAEDLNVPAGRQMSRSSHSHEPGHF